MKTKLRLIALMLAVIFSITGCISATREEYLERAPGNLLNELETADLNALMTKMSVESGDQAVILEALGIALASYKEYDQYGDLLWLEMGYAFDFFKEVTAIDVSPGLIYVSEYTEFEDGEPFIIGLMSGGVAAVQQLYITDASNQEVIIQKIKGLELKGDIQLVILDDTASDTFIQGVLTLAEESRVLPEGVDFTMTVNSEEVEGTVGFTITEIVANKSYVTDIKIIPFEQKLPMPHSVSLIRGSKVSFLNKQASYTFDISKPLIEQKLVLDGFRAFDITDSDLEGNEGSTQLFKELITNDKSEYGYNPFLELYIKDIVRSYGAASSPEEFLNDAREAAEKVGTAERMELSEAGASMPNVMP